MNKQVYEPDSEQEEKLLKIQIEDPHIGESGKLKVEKDGKEKVATINDDGQIILRSDSDGTTS